MDSAIELKRPAGRAVDAFAASEGKDPSVFDKAIKAMLTKATDRLGVIWACIKVIEEREAELKAQADRANLLLKHLRATKDWLREQGTAELVEMEARGEKPAVKRPEFSAMLHVSESVEGPEDATAWPELLQKRELLVKANKAAALARMKAGEAFEGLKIVTSRVIKFA